MRFYHPEGLFDMRETELSMAGLQCQSPWPTLLRRSPEGKKHVIPGDFSGFRNWTFSKIGTDSKQEEMPWKVFSVVLHLLS